MSSSSTLSPSCPTPALQINPGNGVSSSNPVQPSQLTSSWQDGTEGLHQLLSGVWNPLDVVHVIPSGAVKSWRWLRTAFEGPEEKPGKRTVRVVGWHMAGWEHSQEWTLEEDK